MLCFLTGCHEHVSRGSESIYRFAWWTGPTAIAGGFLAPLVAWFLRKRSPKVAIALLFAAPTLFLFVAPAMYRDRVLIDDEHFEATYGLWFAPSFHSLQFDELREIRYVAVPGNRGRTDYELHCLTDTGQVVVVSVGDLVRHSVLEILERAEAKGVRTDYLSQ